MTEENPSSFEFLQFLKITPRDNSLSWRELIEKTGLTFFIYCQVGKKLLLKKD